MPSGRHLHSNRWLLCSRWLPCKNKSAHRKTHEARRTRKTPVHVFMTSTGALQSSSLYLELYLEFGIAKLLMACRRQDYWLAEGKPISSVQQLPPQNPRSSSQGPRRSQNERTSLRSDLRHFPLQPVQCTAQPSACRPPP